MKLELGKPISRGELDLALKGLGTSKGPSLDGVKLNLFKIHWDIIKEDYFLIIS